MVYNDSQSLGVVESDLLGIYSNVTDVDVFLNELQDSEKIILLFEQACAHKTWKVESPTLMKRLVEEISTRSQQSKLSLDQVRQVCQVAQEHLSPSNPLNDQIEIDFGPELNENVLIKTLLLKTLPFYRNMLVSKMEESQIKVIKVNNKSPKIQKVMQFFIQRLKGEEKSNEVEIPNILKESSLEELVDLFERSSGEWLDTGLADLIFTQLQVENLAVALERAIANNNERLIHESLSNATQYFDNFVNFSREQIGKVKIELGNLEKDKIKEFQAILGAFANQKKAVKLKITNKTFKHAPSENLSLLFEDCRGLQELEIKNCSNMNDTILAHLAEKCLGLESLNLSNCVQITDKGIASLAEKCPGLRSVNLELCRKITDVGIASLAEKCPGLESLGLSNCVEITDKGIALLAKGCRDLRSVNLGYCREITDVGIASLAEGCEGLQSLDLRVCKQITNASIAQLAKGCRSLQSLNLNFCWQITIKSIHPLTKVCPSLKSLDLMCCDQITRIDIESLVEKFPNLEIMHSY